MQEFQAAGDNKMQWCAYGSTDRLDAVTHLAEASLASIPGGVLRLAQTASDMKIELFTAD